MLPIKLIPCSLLFAAVLVTAQDLIPIPDEVDIKQKAADAIPDMLNVEIKHRVAFRKQAWEGFWENSRATPEEICEKLGTKGKLVFQLSAADAADFTTLAQLTGQTVADLIDPKYVVLKAGYTVTFATNGTATLHYTAP